jgi:GNAT superfamily N-acetyltransferase
MSIMGTGTVQIRRAKPEDAAAVLAVHDSAWRLAYQGIIPHFHLETMINRRGLGWWKRSLERGGMLVLTFDGQPQGYVTYGRARHAPLFKTGEIYELYLAPPFQGIGLGKRLLLAARRELENLGLKGLIIWALEDNVTACDFYARTGGERCAQSAELYGDTTLPKVAFHWR